MTSVNKPDFIPRSVQVTEIESKLKQLTPEERARVKGKAPVVYDDFQKENRPAFNGFIVHRGDRILKHALGAVSISL